MSVKKMGRDRHNLKCALLGFILAGFAGFAFSSEFPLDDLVDNCPLTAAHTSPQQ
jgi:hypothetical protein